MRNAQAFQIKLRIENEIFREVALEKFAILRFENVERERVAAFLDRVDDLLKLGKHRLPKERAAKIVDLSIDDKSAHLRIACLLEEMMGEQLFVECRCNLGQKNRVLIILKALRLLRKPSVHLVCRLLLEKKKKKVGEVRD